MIRVHQAIDYLKDIGKIHKQQDIADALGMGKARISESLKGKEGKFTDFFVKSFAAAYSDYIDEHWLLTGEGEMAVPDGSLKPHFEAKAAAGFLDGISKGEYSGELKAAVSYLPDYDFSIYAEGDSMMPRIESGDILACRMETDRLNIPLKKICVIDTKNGVLVKVLAAHDDETVTLHSLNPRYPDTAIPADDILNIATVVGIVRSL